MSTHTAPQASTTALIPLTSALPPASPNVPENATNLFSGSNSATFATLSSDNETGWEPCEREAATRIVAESEGSGDVCGGLTITRYGVGRPPASERVDGWETESWWRLEMDDFGPVDVFLGQCACARSGARPSHLRRPSNLLDRPLRRRRWPLRVPRPVVQRVRLPRPLSPLQAPAPWRTQLPPRGHREQTATAEFSISTRAGEPGSERS